VKRKSDTIERRVSATEASRSFSRVLDEIESGRRFLVSRRGQDVCVMAPPPVAGRRASECLAYLRSRSPALLDDRFSDDLLGILREGSVEERAAWGS
jgi:antitoxin (DNA-binding transcriptional repressor) of toxin-antitoxin stability system